MVITVISLHPTIQIAQRCGLKIGLDGMLFNIMDWVNMIVVQSFY